MKIHTIIAYFHDNPQLVSLRKQVFIEVFFGFTRYIAALARIRQQGVTE